MAKKTKKGTPKVVSEDALMQDALDELDKQLDADYADALQACIAAIDEQRNNAE